MKEYIRFLSLGIVASFFLSAGILAQDKVDVSIKVKKDGKVIQDTTYQFDDVSEARHAMKMMEVLSGDDKHMENVHHNYTSVHDGNGHSRAMVFISEDGETTEITEFKGDSNVWVSKEEGDGEHVKVMKYKIIDENGEEFDVVKKKEIKVVVSGDEEGNWTVVEGDEKMMDKDENVYILEGDDDVNVKVMKIMEEEGDGEDVKVIVIKKAGDIDKEHDEDHDKDVEVEVKMIKKEKKK